MLQFPHAHIDVVTDYWHDLCKGIRELKKAYIYSHDAQQSEWEFAVSAGELISLGLSESDLRWLLMKRFAERQVEVTGLTDTKRRFRVSAPHEPLANCCFILSEEGVEHFIAHVNGFVESSASDNREIKKAVCTGQLPNWDPVCHELWWGSTLIKRYRLPSPNQEKVLAAFQEECWPPQIDDPLPPVVNRCSRQRLHDTIRNLNRNQKCDVIRFLGDGTGEGVLWEQRLRKSS